MRVNPTTLAFCELRGATLARITSNREHWGMQTISVKRPHYAPSGATRGHVGLVRVLYVGLYAGKSENGALLDKMESLSNNVLLRTISRKLSPIFYGI